MQSILSVSVSLQNVLLIRNFPLPRKVIFQSNLVLKQWLVCTIFSSIILLHLRLHSSKKYSLTSLHVFTLISSIISLRSAPRMMNQSILLTPQFLHFFATTQPTFLKYFCIFLIFMQFQKFYHEDGHKRYKRAAGRERPTTRKRVRGPRLSRNRRQRRSTPTAPAFPGQSTQ